MLDARSGQLLTSQSFPEAFSQLQFAGDGVSYLLHRTGSPERENIELHHLTLGAESARVVARYGHAPQVKVRPSLWRGSLSPDSSLLVYQEDVLKPEIQVVNGKDGSRVSVIRWDEDLTALPVHVDPNNELIVVPLARWDTRYTYAASGKFLVAELKSGRILGQYESPYHISQVRFQGQRLLLISHSYEVGRLEIGSPTIAWTQNEELKQPGANHYYLSNPQAAGYYSRKNGEDAGEFRLLNSDGTVITNRFSVEKGFLPVALRGGMLIGEKYSSRELPTWLQKINERFNSVCGRYVVSPVNYTMRYHDAVTGALLAEYQSEHRKADGLASRFTTGTSRLAAIYHDEDHLRVEFSEVFPVWTASTIALWALVATVVVSLGVVGWQRGSGHLSY